MTFCGKCGAPIRSERIFKPCLNCGAPQNTAAVKLVLKIMAVIACVGVVIAIRLAIWGPF